MEFISAVGAIATPITLIIAVLTFMFNRKREAVTDAKTDSRHDGTIISDIGYIKSSTDDIKAEIKQQRADITEIKVELAQVSASAKQAHKRLDRLEGMESHE